MKRTYVMSALLLSAVFMASSAYALGFATVVKTKDQEKISRCAWESNPDNFNPVALKGKPGKRDNVWIRTDGKDFEIDVPVEFKDLSVTYNSRATATGKKIVINRGNLNFNASGSPNNINFLKLIKSEIDVNGSLTFTFWEKLRGSCPNTLYLDDSKMNLTGNILFTMPAMYMKATKNKSGGEINLTGASLIKAKGSLISDSILNELPDMHFRLVLNEKDGKVPFLSVGDATLDGVEIQVNIKGALKKGVYPILEISGKNAPKGKIRAIYLNGKVLSLGSEAAVAGSDVSIALDSSDGKGPKNDYVLIVK